MKQQLFTWQNKDHSEEHTTYYGPVLTQSIGTKLCCIDIHFVIGEIWLFEESNITFTPNAKFKLYYQVGESID